MDKLSEVQQILNTVEIIDLDAKVKYLKKIYKSELKEFRYVLDPNIFLKVKKIYIKYIGFDDKIYYGGIFYKADKKNNNIVIFLINKNKKVWSIDFNKYYIFISDIVSSVNEKTRKIFELYLKKNNQNV
jgi:hypothetical protein